MTTSSALCTIAHHYVHHAQLELIRRHYLIAAYASVEILTPNIYGKSTFFFVYCFKMKPLNSAYFLFGSVSGWRRGFRRFCRWIWRWTAWWILWALVQSHGRWNTPWVVPSPRRSRPSSDSHLTTWGASSRLPWWVWLRS